MNSCVQYRISKACLLSLTFGSLYWLPLHIICTNICWITSLSSIINRGNAHLPVKLHPSRRHWIKSVTAPSCTFIETWYQCLWIICMKQTWSLVYSTISWFYLHYRIQNNCWNKFVISSMILWRVWHLVLLAIRTLFVMCWRKSMQRQYARWLKPTWGMTYRMWFDMISLYMNNECELTHTTSCLCST